MERPTGVVCLVWLCGVACVCCMLSASMQVVLSLFMLLRGRGPLAPVPTWLGGSSWRGRFGDSGVSAKASSIAASEGRGSEGGGRRALHDPISLLIVDAPGL